LTITGTPQSGQKPRRVMPPLFAGRPMEAERALQEPEGFRRHDYEKRKRPATGSLAIATMAVKHHHGFCYGFVANRAARAAASKWDLHGAFYG